MKVSELTPIKTVDKDLELVWVPGLNELRITRSSGEYWPFQFHPDDDKKVEAFVRFLTETPIVEKLK